MRSAPYGDGRRLLIVTGEKFTPGTGDPEQRLSRLRNWVTERFPGVEPTRWWATQDAFATDSVPLVGLLHPGSRHIYVATGFGGWGLSGGIMAGSLLTALVTGREAPAWRSLYDPRRLRPVLRDASRLLRHQADVARHFVGDRLPSSEAGGSVDRIPRGEGAVVRAGGRRLAVHRDEDGALHAVSARCTHLGCLVALNAAECAWECPCHGSRFATDGRVLEGPATKPLEQRDI